MDLDQAGAGGEMPGRVQAFTQGTTGTPWNVASSFNTGSQVLDSQVAGSWSPQSVLDPVRSSGNGMSSADYERVLPGNVRLPSMNGSSTGSYNAAKYMRLMGQAAI